MKVQQSSEDYLETILVLSKRLPVVRAVDIAEETGHKNSSISVAMKKLRTLELITVTDAGFIYLTDVGAKIANNVYERHTLFTKWLIELGVNPTIAEEDACRIEHVLSEESFLAIKKRITECEEK
ncbi:iron (metal) dependent repressor, DtxR family [Lachnospiraceae bacterium C10]|jgi:Mn-dependent DtxR family transcriptional regulator|nr:iron (metal) dependent repressor, DtxR family [Lachnospiraceae bacterium C10]SDW99439.1 Mn-dependent transcriptional regulator, DtxR family [Lachnospiraceae bacterium KHCPX20]